MTTTSLNPERRSTPLRTFPGWTLVEHTSGEFVAVCGRVCSPYMATAEEAFAFIVDRECERTPSIGIAA